MNVRLSLTMGFPAGIYYQDRLALNDYRIKLNLVTVSADNVEQNIALDRIKYFITEQLAHSVFINSTEIEQCKRLLHANVKITTLPEQPFDQVIGIVLYSKLNAITEDRLSVTEIEISSTLGDNIVYLHSDLEQLGPFESAGWWKETDAEHCDSDFYNDDKIVALNSVVSWRELGLGWEESLIEPNEDNRVLFADFQRDDTK